MFVRGGEDTSSLSYVINSVLDADEEGSTSYTFSCYISQETISPQSELSDEW